MGLNADRSFASPHLCLPCIDGGEENEGSVLMREACRSVGHKTRWKLSSTSRAQCYTFDLPASKGNVSKLYADVGRNIARAVGRNSFDFAAQMRRKSYVCDVIRFITFYNRKRKRWRSCGAGRGGGGRGPVDVSRATSDLHQSYSDLHLQTGV